METNEIINEEVVEAAEDIVKANPGCGKKTLIAFLAGLGIGLVARPAINYVKAKRQAKLEDKSEAVAAPEDGDYEEVTDSND